MSAKHLILASVLCGGILTSGSAQAETISAVIPDPRDCKVAPLTESELEAARSAPVATVPIPAEGDELPSILQAFELTEEELPAGVAADQEVVDAITSLQIEYVACLNAGELARAAALLTPRERTEFLESVAGLEFTDRLTRPEPLPEEMQIPSVAVRSVRSLPGNRVGALVDWGPETNYQIHEFVDGRWLMDKEISIYGDSMSVIVVADDEASPSP